jgi:hypothetical protein
MAAEHTLVPDPAERPVWFSILGLETDGGRRHSRSSRGATAARRCDRGKTLQSHLQP